LPGGGVVDFPDGVSVEELKAGMELRCGL
jgi:hypothetical protein